MARAAGSSTADRNTASSTRAILEDFFVAGAGRFKAKLKNLYIYFWRWATWKVWESTAAEPDGDAGIVCFISTSGYLAGQPFTGMREYLRRYASDGWIIDLTPGGPDTRHPHPDLSRRTPAARDRPVPAHRRYQRSSSRASIRYRAVSGLQADKFAALAAIGLDDDGWREARSGWTEPLTPAAAGGWDTYPAMSDLMPWYSPGVFPTRTWVYAPNADTLRRRWRMLDGRDRSARLQAEMFKESRRRHHGQGQGPTCREATRIKHLPAPCGSTTLPSRARSVSATDPSTGNGSCPTAG